MFRWSTSGIAFALLLSSQMLSFGLIGETPDQCTARYGVPTRQDENSTEYRLKNRVLVVTFMEGRAASITCSDAPSERGGAAVHFQEIPKFQEPQAIGFFSASSGERPFGFKNLANLPWDLLKFLWGEKEPSALYLGMWSTHLTDPDLDVQNNWLIGLNIEGFFLGTFVNSYDKRSWAAGIERRLWSLGKKNGLNASLGYRLGLMTGYEERFTMADYKHLLNGVVSIDQEISMKALSLAQQTAKRIPLVDSLIAAVVCLKNATLLYRDQHFESIPKSLHKTESL